MILTPSQFTVRYVVELDEVAGTALCEGWQRQRYTYNLKDLKAEGGIEEIRGNHRSYLKNIVPFRCVLERFIAVIYVAGPYTNGDVEQNVQRAIAAGNELADKGFAPIVPRLSYFWNIKFPRPYEWWMRFDEILLLNCNAMLRLRGFSEGSEAEMVLARQISMPVFDQIDDLVAHFEKHPRK